jgi:hypothetical protein
MTQASTKTKVKSTTKTQVASTNDANEILVRRKGLLYVKPGNESHPVLAKAIAINIASLGYIMTPELVRAVQTISKNEIKELSSFLEKRLSKLVGAHVKYRPLFRNFPEDVPDTFEYYIERVVAHFESVLGLTEDAKLLSCGHLIDTEKWDMSNLGACPVCQFQLKDEELLPAKKRENLNEKIKLKTLDLAMDGEIFEVFKNLLSSSTSISEQDKEDVTLIFETNKDEIKNHFPERIPHKEVLSFVSALVIKHLDDFVFMAGKVKTATDVLRIAVALSGGDVSLSKAEKFRNFKKRERRFLLTLLEGCSSIKEDMTRHEKRWLRLGEILHPGEYKKRFPKSYEAFYAIRNGEKIETFNSKTEKLMSDGDLTGLSNHLKERPSELARKLDYIISSSNESQKNYTINSFISVAGKIPTPLLLQLMANFRIRATADKDIRIIMPKGSLAKVKFLEEKRKPISIDVRDEVCSVISEVLIKRFSSLPAMGKVYVGKELSECVVPSSQRSASKALVTITRGSRIPMSDDNTVRMFSYWKQPAGVRTDVDLSAILFDSDWNYKDHLSFTSYHAYNCVHSGDIQSAPHGAAEFIDIDKKACVENGVRYVAMNIYCFTGQPFVDMPESFAGIMGRKKPKSGEIFEPKTVKQKFDVSSDSAVSIPLVLDLVENKMIWCDLSLKGAGRYLSVESNKGNVKLMCKAMTKYADFKPNIKELLDLHVKARGEAVDSSEESDTSFTGESVPKQLDEIMGEFLA